MRKCVRTPRRTVKRMQAGTDTDADTGGDTVIDTGNGNGTDTRGYADTDRDTQAHRPCQVHTMHTQYSSVRNPQTQRSNTVLQARNRTQAQLFPRSLRPTSPRLARLCPFLPHIAHHTAGSSARSTHALPTSFLLRRSLPTFRQSNGTRAAVCLALCCACAPFALAEVADLLEQGLDAYATHARATTPATHTHTVQISTRGRLRRLQHADLVTHTPLPVPRSHCITPSHLHMVAARST